MTMQEIAYEPASATHRGIDELCAELGQLRSKLANQPVIEEAKGMLMGAFGISSDEAFELLRTASQSNNVKLRDVARHLVARWTADGPRPEFAEAADFLVALRHEFGASRQSRVGADGIEPPTAGV
ncbi:MAG TPA: ANTAR domain-containing protein [Mycobacterium sp.]|nr:ANTAR domain-containing protein [Mycobacterium sp.]